MSDTRIELAGRIAAVLRSAPTDFDVGGVDFTECRCKIHRAFTCQVKGGKGCEARKPGTHPSIASLYNPAVSNRYCHARPEVRQKDQAFVRALLDLGNGADAFWRPDGWKDGKRFETGDSCGVGEFGAYYCYLEGVRACGRMRSARVTGGLAYVADALRIARVMGQARMRCLKVQKISENVYHVVKDPERKGTDPLAGVDYVKQLLEILERGELHARIGADPRAFQLLELLKSVVVGTGDALGASKVVDSDEVSEVAEVVSVEERGGLGDLFGYREYSTESARALTETAKDRVFRMLDYLRVARIDLPQEALLDLALVTIASNIQPDGFPGLKEKVRVYALVGDAAMKMVTALFGLATSKTAQEVSQLGSRFSNPVLARCLDKSGFRRHCEVGNLTDDAKANADIVEAVLGVIAVYAGFPAVVRAMNKFGIRSYQLPATHFKNGAKVKSVATTSKSGSVQIKEADDASRTAGAVDDQMEMFKQFMLFQDFMKARKD